MNCEIINTGSELLLGQVLNTHLTFLGGELFPLGFRITRQITIPDGAILRAALEESYQRKPDLVLVTGGLGPTTDDLTRDILVELTGGKLVQDATILGRITERFASRNLCMSDRVQLQALVPEGVTPIPNDWGTAPGLHWPAGADHSLTIFLPGPPRELRPMFLEKVVPLLRSHFPATATIQCGIWRIAGLGESQIEDEAGPALMALPGVELGYCARSGEVDVRVIGPADTVTAAGHILETTFGSRIFARDHGTMEQSVIGLLRAQCLTIATAESCTGGFLAHRLTNVPGASEVFIEGHVTYANEAKVRILGVDPDLIAHHGAVSEPVAAAMATRTKLLAGTDFALSTTGVAGPGGGTAAKPTGTVFIGLATPQGTSVTSHFYPTDRENFKQMVCQTALERLRQSLLPAGSVANTR